MVIQKSAYKQQFTNNECSQKLFYNLYHSDSQKIKATVVILHGMQEHSGRYHDFAGHLADAGFAVLTYDHLGHGKTARDKNDLGFFQSQNPDKQVVDDAESMAELMETLYPEVPHFLIGHSMGSFIARCLLQQASHLFAGAVIIGTGGKTNGAKLLKSYFAWMNKIKPRHHTGFNKVFSYVNNRHFRNEKNTNGLNWLSLNQANRTAYLRDELCGLPFSNNGFYTLLSLNVRATRRNWANLVSGKLPFLFVSGANDPIGNFGKGVNKTVKDMKKDGFEDVAVRLYPDMRHEILNEDIRLQVYNDIEEWMVAHL